MADTTTRDALERTICARLAACSPDELRVVDYVLGRLEVGRARYGELDFAGDDRDFLEEERQEHADGVVYRACAEIVRLDARRDRLRCEAADELTARVDAGLDELRHAEVQRRRAWLGDHQDEG